MRKIINIILFCLLPNFAMAQTPVKVVFDDAKPKTNLENILKDETIGKNYRKLGKFLGKVDRVDGRARDYKVDNCNLRLWVFRNEGRVNPQYDGIIEAIELEITPNCNFKFTNIFPSLAPNKSANEITIKDIARKETEFYSKCFLECGEAKYQPIEFRYGIKQEDGYLAIDFIIDPILNPQTSLLANKIAEDFKKQGALISDDINCNLERSKAAIKAFENEKITRIRYGMEDMNKGNLPSCKVQNE